MPRMIRLTDPEGEDIFVDPRSIIAMVPHIQVVRDQTPEEGLEDAQRQATAQFAATHGIPPASARTGLSLPPSAAMVSKTPKPPKLKLRRSTQLILRANIGGNSATVLVMEDASVVHDKVLRFGL